MATDLAAIVRNLTGFYDFGGKTVVVAGAGGGQLADYARSMGHVVAIDRDPAACACLAGKVRALGLESRFTIVQADFLDVEPRGDAILFEFCLHQMADPARALAHAARLAGDLLVLDHAPGSPWEWYAAEDRAVEAAWAAVERIGPRRVTDFQGTQQFASFAELEARLSEQGSESRARIEAIRAQAPVEIPMPYRIALLQAAAAGAMEILAGR